MFFLKKMQSGPEDEVVPPVRKPGRKDSRSLDTSSPNSLPTNSSLKNLTSLNLNTIHNSSSNNVLNNNGSPVIGSGSSSASLTQRLQLKNSSKGSHLFIIQGEVTKICCDASLIHVADNLANIEQLLFPDYARDKVKLSKEEKRIFKKATLLREAGKWPSDSQVFKLGQVDEEIHASWPAKKPSPWFFKIEEKNFLNSYTDGLRLFLQEIGKEFDTARKARFKISIQSQQTGTPVNEQDFIPKFNRVRNLVAIPIVIGENSGSVARIVKHIMHTIYTLDCDFDIALVSPNQAVCSATQAARRQLAESCEGFDPFMNLTHELKSQAEALGKLAFQRNLVLFIGAGCSMGAGLPSWAHLLTGLAADASITGEDEQVTRMFQSMNFLDQAKLIEKKMGSKWLHDKITKRVEGNSYSISHAILSSLPISEVVTTNYDTLFEQACESWNCEISVIPYDSSHKDKWILKMHGCVTHPEDIVLTREDYIQYSERRAALSGIVQTLLMTKHMLFVGFSLNDDNFFKIASTVKKALPPPNLSSSSENTKSKFSLMYKSRREDLEQMKTYQADISSCNGTVLNLRNDEMLNELWKGDFNMVSMCAQDFAEGARRLEIFLDYIAANSVTCTKYSMDQKFASALTPEERLFRDCLENFVTQIPTQAKNSAAYLRFHDILNNEFGLSQGSEGEDLLSIITNVE